MGRTQTKLIKELSHDTAHLSSNPQGCLMKFHPKMEKLCDHLGTGRAILLGGGTKKCSISLTVT